MKYGEMAASEYRSYKTQQSFPAKDKKSALAAGKTKYFSRCGYGHEVKYTNGTCVGCAQEKKRAKLKRSSAMIDIERLKDEMKLQSLIGEGYDDER
tara:strand:- start:187 stop:474 length:288 start_codon:yes stop_codon:yes gene_type:complete